MGRKATISYNLKATTGQLNIHEEKYSPELRQYVEENLAEMIHYFGYAKVGDNPTGFFEFPSGPQTTQNMQNFKKFKSDSKDALDQVCSSNFDHRKHYVTNTGDMVPMFTPQDMAKVQIPGSTQGRKELEKAKQAKN